MMMTKRLISAALGVALTFGGALPAFAHNPEEKELKIEQAVDLACMQNAVEKRDSVVMTAFDAFHTAVRSALEARKNALKTAWGMTDPEDRKDAREEAWEDYFDAFRKAKRDLKKARKAAWHQFRHDRQACGARADEGEGNADAQL